MKRTILTTGLALVLVALVLVGLAPVQRVDAQRAVPCYMTGFGWFCASGGTLEMMTGSTLQVDSGATFTVNGLYPLLSAGSGRKLVIGNTGTFTGTKAIGSGLSTITAAGATACSDPVSNAAVVSASISGVTLTVKSWKADNTTAGSVGTTACYWMVGVP